MTDAIRGIDEVDREIRGRVVDGADAPTVMLTRVYNGPVEDVWDACTNPERIPRWFLPVSGELRLGGRYQLEGNAGGTIEQCDPPHSFRITWEFGGNRSWLELRLTEQAAGVTRLELEHIAPDDGQRWEEYGPGAVGVGWDLGLIGLAIHLQPGGQPGERPDHTAWSSSEQGRRYIARSSQAWGDAAVRAGADPADARAAAANTAAFYTGVPSASSSAS